MGLESKGIVDVNINKDDSKTMDGGWSKIRANSFYGRTSFRQISRLTKTVLGNNVDIKNDEDRPRSYIDRDERFENDIEKMTEDILKNVFLNDKCRNACDIKKFIAGIDFSKENYNNLLMDYVGGNAEIISKNYKSLPEHERPVYSFDGEDEHQKVAHIQHDNKWIVERELGWEKQVRREYNDGVNDDPEPNSMYSLVRLFDKKKMKYFDENYKQSHLYLSQRKLNRDCLDDGKQLELINRIIEMAKVEP